MLLVNKSVHALKKTDDTASRNPGLGNGLMSGLADPGLGNGLQKSGTQGTKNKEKETNGRGGGMGTREGRRSNMRITQGGRRVCWRMESYAMGTLWRP
jgi:hypothetical protein